MESDIIGDARRRLQVQQEMIVGYKNLGTFALYGALILLVVIQQRQVGSSAYRDQYTAVREQIFGFVDEATGVHTSKIQHANRVPPREEPNVFFCSQPTRRP